MAGDFGKSFRPLAHNGPGQPKFRERQLITRRNQPSEHDLHVNNIEAALT